ncbi:unnamed protein product [Coregonus sp. 'balchen']|nr:unnamed protein product [Coregonus sp. 'balchen']
MGLLRTMSPPTGRWGWTCTPHRSTNQANQGQTWEEEEEEKEEEEEEEGTAWSITYVSWLTFVFLIWSCTLWMVRDRRQYAMITSPFMVFYGNLLIILQYIWSFELLQPVPGLFLKKEVPFRELGSKMLCLLSFWLLLRQALTERKERQREEEVLSDIRVIHAHKKGKTAPESVSQSDWLSV